MNRAPLFLLSLLLGSAACGSAANDCDKAMVGYEAQVTERLGLRGRHEVTAEEKQTLRQVFTAATKLCREDKWSSEATSCLAKAATGPDFGKCVEKLSDAQKAKMQTAGEPMMPIMKKLFFAQMELATTTVRKLELEAYPLWAKAHPDKACPATLAEVLEYSDSKDSKDPWGREYHMVCGKDLPAGAETIAFISDGSDEQAGTPDDIKSWLREH